MPHGFLGISPEEYGRACDLAQQILQLSRNALLLHLRFLDGALNRLGTVIHNEIVFATDGNALYFEPLHLLERYKKEPEVITRDYLHVLLHCLLRHPFLHERLERRWWDLACDITVEALIAELGLDATVSARQQKQTAVIADLKKQVKKMTAEKLYRHFLKNPPADQNDLRVLFRADDHGLWYQEKGFNPNSAGSSQAERDWENLSRHVQGDLETFSRQRSDRAGDLLQNLLAVNREKYDYTAFLRKFATRSEAMVINDDEFDYIFYTYGMKVYGNMPLIEPLEYKDIKSIREFVIAIDTSGSVRGDLVQAFVQKTYNVLKSTETFASKIHLRIIQCDAAVQEDVKITSQAEFDDYLQHMTLRGFGGTDFRPVFAHVDALIAKGEFDNLKGLIYFTDGLGIYPSRRPDYDAAFVFLEEDYHDREVPPWAMKLILQPEEI